ncbi:MAG: ABC transporter permease subunit [Deltaproteobacteria bacterium]|jgi:putative spermidine/putrescine transport system permease protein|nr:ABC transporter permease subunit [Deltaproteobacteria bacterium]
MKKGPFFWAQLAVTVLASVFLVAPVLYTVMVALSKNAFVGIGSGLTSEWIEKVFSLYGDTIVRGLLISLGTLGCCVVLGVPCAYFLVKSGKSKISMALEESLVLPLSVPGLAIGLGMLLSWGETDWFRKSSFFIMAGHVIFCLPFMVRSVAAVLRMIPLSRYEEAASSMGVGFAGRFAGIVVPLTAPGILAGSLQTIALSLGEFNITWMLQTPFTRTLPVGLADSYASMRLEIGSAYTLVFLLLIIPLLVLAQKLPGMISRKFGERGETAGPGEAPEPPSSPSASPTPAAPPLSGV